jgi:hypothetical protein
MIFAITGFGVEYATSEIVVPVVRAAAVEARARAVAATTARRIFFRSFLIDMMNKYITTAHSSNKYC